MSFIVIANFYPQLIMIIICINSIAQTSRKCNSICILQYIPLTRLKKPARFMDVYET